MQAFTGKEKLVHGLADDLRMTESGFMAFLFASYCPEGQDQVVLPDEQYDSVRTAFFGGAKTMYLMLTEFAPSLPDEQGMMMLTLIDAELKKFIRIFELKHGISREDDK